MSATPERPVTAPGPGPTELLGAWRLERTIEDRYAGRTLTLAGTTELTLLADGRVRWHDQGTLHLPDGDVEATRTSLVERRDGGWFVLFEDGRDFHPWAPGTPVEHPCGRDLYRGTVQVGSGADGAAAAWHVVWEVRGPAKDYTMVSRMTSVPHSPPGV